MNQDRRLEVRGPHARRGARDHPGARALLRTGEPPPARGCWPDGWTRQLGRAAGAPSHGDPLGRNQQDPVRSPRFAAPPRARRGGVEQHDPVRDAHHPRQSFGLARTCLYTALHAKSTITFIRHPGRDGRAGRHPVANRWSSISRRVGSTPTPSAWEGWPRGRAAVSNGCRAVVLRGSSPSPSARAGCSLGRSSGL